MTTITLTNSFHNTSITLRPRNGRLSQAQVRKARKALCGMADCHCGGDLGERPQDGRVLVYPDGHGEIQ